MYSLINSNFSRTYNPSGRQNALSDIKRLLTSRDTSAQCKACGYLIEVINRYNENSEEGERMVEYLLDNDITVFLCEATSNLDFALFKCVVTCLRLLWRSERFFSEEHAAQAAGAALRALAYFAASGPPLAVDTCLHFLCDLLNGISTYKTTPPLSHQSAYSAVQLLACLNSLATLISTNPKTILSSALVLEALIAYQPDGLYINGSTAKPLSETVGKWLALLVGALNHSILIGEGAGMIYVVTCHISIDVLRLIKLLHNDEKKVDFVQAILADDQHVNLLKQCSIDMAHSVQRVMSELVGFTKEHQTHLDTDEYCVFLKFLLSFFNESSLSDVLPDFCDMLFTNGYLTMLPQVQITRERQYPTLPVRGANDHRRLVMDHHRQSHAQGTAPRLINVVRRDSHIVSVLGRAYYRNDPMKERQYPTLPVKGVNDHRRLVMDHHRQSHAQGTAPRLINVVRRDSQIVSVLGRAYYRNDPMKNDPSVRKASTLVLGEMLKVLSDKYLNLNNNENDGTCANDIHMGLVELQYGIEKPQSIGMQFQKGQPYSLLIYIYFYCQSSENPEEATAFLLPFLVEHILRLPKQFKPPPYIVKALWLVFAMSTISNGSLDSLEQRVYLEKATERLVDMLNSDPSVYYTHNPAILLWAFTSQRIPNYVKIHVLSQWLKLETSLPSDLTTDPTVWELLLNILIQSNDRTIVENCMQSLHICVDDGEDDMRQEFTSLVWFMLPNVLSKALIDDSQLATNTCYLLDLATTLLPLELDSTQYLKTAVLITAIFSKNNSETKENSQTKDHFEYVCLKLCLYLLGLANNQNDNRVLLTYVNRVGFLPSVLSSSNSSDEMVACAALQLLSYVIHYFTKNNYQPNSVLQIQTRLIIQSLRRDSNSERGASLLQLVYMILNSGANAPLVLDYNFGDSPVLDRQCNALRCLMFRIQLMLCCRDSKDQSSAGWKTLSSVYKHAIVSKNDTKLVATLTSQPWTLTLIQFQVTQPVTPEFLTFLHNWLTLLKITVKKIQEGSRTQLSKNGLVIRTMAMLKKNLVGEEDQKELVKKITVIVKDILNDSTIRIKH